jgi:hypothetical protein
MRAQNVIGPIGGNNQSSEVAFRVPVMERHDRDRIPAPANKDWGDGEPSPALVPL